MEESEAKQYPQYTRTFHRNSRIVSVVACFYLRFVLLFLFFFILAYIIVFFKEGVTYDSMMNSFFFACGSGVFMAILIAIGDKGSLVDTVRIDYKKQEIRILRYTLFNRQQNVVIPFKGFYWDVSLQPRRFDRLRLFSSNGQKIVICIGTLGWSIEEVHKLQLALSKIVDEDVICL